MNSGSQCSTPATAFSTAPGGGSLSTLRGQHSREMRRRLMRCPGARGYSNYPRWSCSRQRNRWGCAQKCLRGCASQTPRLLWLLKPPAVRIRYPVAATYGSAPQRSWLNVSTALEFLMSSISSCPRRPGGGGTTRKSSFSSIVLLSVHCSQLRKACCAARASRTQANPSFCRS